eukprot:6094568-Prymnesium_polylepis.1
MARVCPRTVRMLGNHVPCGENGRRKKHRNGSGLLGPRRFNSAHGILLMGIARVQLPERSPRLRPLLVG